MMYIPDIELNSIFNPSINLILIWVYPRKWGWPDLPCSNSNLFNSHSPSRSIQDILLLQTNTLALPLHLCLPLLSLLSSPPLALHFKLQCFSQNTPIIPPQHIHVCTISLHSPLPSEPPSPSIPTSITNQKLLHEHILEEKKKTDFILQHSTGY